MASISFIKRQLNSVRSEAMKAAGSQTNLHHQACTAINKLRLDLINASSPELSEYIKRSIGQVRTSDGDPPFPENGGAALLVCNLLIDICDEQLEHTPTGASERITGIPAENGSRPNSSRASGNNCVFIVHGHDEANLLRLERLVEKRWALTPLVLRDQPSAGHTIIEKFESVAEKCTFAFILLTPDDQITTAAGSVYQARPNVIFELGWFFGRLGRNRVCILYQEGTQIHSDLSGIIRIEFQRTVEEKIGEIESELRAGGLI